MHVRTDRLDCVDVPLIRGIPMKVPRKLMVSGRCLSRW